MSNHTDLDELVRLIELSEAIGGVTEEEIDHWDKILETTIIKLHPPTNVRN